MKFSLSSKIFLSIILITALFSAVSVFSLLRMVSFRSQMEVFRKGIVPLRFELKGIGDSADRLVNTLSRKEASDILIIKKWIKFFDPFLKITRLERLIDKRIDSLKGKLDNDSNRLFTKIQNRLLRIEQGTDFYIYLNANYPELLKNLNGLNAAKMDNHSVFSITFAYVLEKMEKENQVNRQGIDFLIHSLLSIKRKVSIIQRGIIKFSRIFAEQLDSQEDQSILSLIIILFLSLVISITILLLVNISLKPISRLTEAVKRIREGDFSDPIKISAGGEIGLLAFEFNKMVHGLKLRDNMIEQQKERILRSEKLAVIGKMASFIAHEVRNPLSSMSLNAEILEEELQAKKDLENLKLVNAISNEIERLKGVTEQYLQFTRPTEPELLELNITDILISIKNFFTPEFENNNIIVSIEAPDTLMLKIDANFIKQAFVNIIKNSIEALKESKTKHLKIKVSKIDNFCAIVIRDSGKGIEKQDIKRVFEPFFSGKKQGTGLGMAITRDIIEKHNGKIEIKSVPQQFCEVTVLLPISP